MGYFRRHSDVYHYNISVQTDTLKFEDYYGLSPVRLGGISTRDFEFWNDDPPQFISCGEEIEINPDAYIRRYDVGIVWSYPGGIDNVETSRQNHIQYYFLVSADAGDSWQVIFSNPMMLHLTVDPLLRDTCF